MNHLHEETLNTVMRLSWQNHIALLRFDSPPVNALSHIVRASWQNGMTRALEAGAKAVIVICSGQTFFAGADITEFGKPFQAPDLLELQQQMDRAQVPIIAAIHGTALGGGLEMALACHYRIASDSAQFGLPEVNLGLLPGGGGTQRTPRLVGVKTAIDLIAGGKPVRADKALSFGLVDRVVRQQNLMPPLLLLPKKLSQSERPCAVRAT